MSKFGGHIESNHASIVIEKNCKFLCRNCDSRAVVVVVVVTSDIFVSKIIFVLVSVTVNENKLIFVFILF